MIQEGHRSRLRMAAALATVGAAVALLYFNGLFREMEAATSAEVVRAVGLRASSINTAVVFRLDGRLVGYALTAGCSAALILSPLYLVVAGLLSTARLTVGRALACVVVITAVIFTVNQLRFVVIAWSMRTWGFVDGYERSHIFLGTLVSTLGVLAGLLLLLRQVTLENRGRRADG